MSSARQGLACLTLFAAPFVLSGLFVIGLSIRGFATDEPPQKNLMTALFGAVFTLAGLAIIAAAIYGTRRANAEAALKARHPGEPWMWKPEWAARRIGDGSRASIVVLWIFTLIWNALSAPVVFILPAELARGNRGIWIAILFPLVGIGLLIAALRATLRRMRFRESFLVLDSLPASPGGVMRGHVEIPVERTTFAAATSIVATLSCIHRRVTGSGKSRSTSETARWQEIVHIPAGSVGMMQHGSTLQLSIPLPLDVPSTDMRNPNDATIWRLGVEADVPGIDYTATFELPVFATAAAHAAAPPPSTFRATSAPATRTIRERETTEGLVIEFPAFRLNSAAAAVFVFAVIFGGSGFFAGTVGAPFIFPLIFGLIGLILLYVAIDLFFGTSTMLVHRDGIRETRRLLFTRTLEYPSTLIRDVRMKIGMQQTRVGGTPTAWYHLEIVRLNGKPKPIGRAIRDKREAEWLVTRIHKRLGLDTSR